MGYLNVKRHRARLVPVEPDHVDHIVAQWHEQRPDLDVSGMAIVGRISRLELMVRPLLARVFARHGLEAWEFDLLATLRRHGPPYQLTAGDLMGAMMITSGAVTNRIDRLERRGLITRDRHPTDGRKVLVALTGSGRDLVDGAVADHAANELNLIATLEPDERQTLIDLLRKLHHSWAHSTE
jgi:DNA-binding MarR family transcriptional regulator